MIQKTTTAHLMQTILLQTVYFFLFMQINEYTHTLLLPGAIVFILYIKNKHTLHTIIYISLIVIAL